VTAGIPERRFEAVICAWDQIGAPQEAERDRLRDLIEDACDVGLEVAIVATDDLDDVDDRLRARPGGPGRLHLLAPGAPFVLRVGVRGPAFEALGLTLTTLRDALDWMLADLWCRGVGAGLALVVGDRLCAPGRATAAPRGTTPKGLLDLLADQVARRLRRDPPEVAPEPGWALAFDGLDTQSERSRESLLTLADGQLGTRGSVLAGDAAARPLVVAAGVYEGRGITAHLRPAPLWNLLGVRLHAGDSVRRVLDLHSGLLGQELGTDAGPVRATLLSCLARPGTVALRAGGPQGVLHRAQTLSGPEATPVDAGIEDGAMWMRAANEDGGVVAVAEQSVTSGDGGARLERLVSYAADGDGSPSPASARRRLKEAATAGFEQLLGEHRAAWARRWRAADVRVDGDDDLTLAARLALFHVIGSVGETGESAVGARGLSGTGYRGHVFWDSDVYVLPVLAATHPPAARAMLQYRIRRLGAAAHGAAVAGRAGARFPWESAASGRDVTPRHGRDRAGQRVQILTGQQEEHIVADVAWAAATYAEWSGDDAFLAGDGSRLLVDTARYWASRVELDDDGRGHIRGVIGPDEYHVGVDDNAFTNVMARWNLRRAAGLPGIPDDERRGWLERAECIVDGHDPATGLYEQFAGFGALEPLVIADLAPRRPIVAELLLGADRVARAQVVKQADVLMLHHLVPEEVAPGSLATNLGFYEPRTAHASSLSPGVHAALFARAGRLDEAVEWLRLTARIDLDDLSGTTAGGVHLAAMASVWHALVLGFAGVRPRGDALSIGPRLPAAWKALELRLGFRGAAVTLTVHRDRVELTTDGTLRVHPAGAAQPLTIEPPGTAFAVDDAM